MPSTPLTKQVFSELLRSRFSKPYQLMKIHALVLTSGLSVKNSLLTQILENLIVLGDMCYARKVFDEMHKPRIFLWNTFFKGYVKNQIPVESVMLYKQMCDLGIKPDDFTYPFVVKACSELRNVPCGLALHAHVLKHGFDYLGIVRTELVMMYVKFSELGSADLLFETMEDKDLVAWNAFIAVCVQTGNSAKALKCYQKMVKQEHELDAYTVVSLLSACGQLGCLETGEEIYHRARSMRIDCNVIVENARLDMYVKCGSIKTARILFDIMKQRNIVTWGTMIIGCAMNGESREALELFGRMKNEGLRPNHVAFLGALIACSHAGLVEEGKRYFNIMATSDDKNLEPRKEHYACVVDLLGRSGHLDEAYEFIMNMPVDPDVGIWGALLGACAIHRNVEMGQKVADLLVEHASEIGSYQVLLSNMYAGAGRWDSVDKVRRRMRKRGVRKVAAYSAIECDGGIHIFHRGERRHLEWKAIYDKLEEMLKKMREMGYVAETGSVYHDVEMEEKEASVRHHSEKLAVVYGVMKVRDGCPIRVMKNLRTCEDCHVFLKLVSLMTSREIIVRDNKRFHRFSNGECSCREFW